MKYSVKEDCFAYLACKEKCKALDKLYCKNEYCSFYKNKDKENEERIGTKKE